MIDQFAQLSLKLDIISSGILTIPANTTLNIDIPFTHLRHVTGAEYFKKDGNFEDTITFQVIHPLAGVLDQFATNLIMKEYNSYSFYKATLSAGLIVRVIYKNQGVVDAKFAFNLICHQDKP